MISREKTERLTAVGPGTPMGNLLRRYWWPVATHDMAGRVPVRRRLLGEDLVVFRDASGTLGLLAEHCPHRRASLALGCTERTVLEGQTEQDEDWKTGHPLVFPGMLRVGGGGIATFQIRVPVDDTHTWHVWYQTYRFDAPAAPQGSIPVYRVPLHDEQGEWLRDYVDGQDICAWVTQGAIADRTREHLGRSDLGVIMLRKLYFEQMELVEAGRDPICTHRDPVRNVCIDLPMEREKFGGAGAFRDMWLHESSIRYSPIRDQVLRQFGDVPRRADAAAG